MLSPDVLTGALSVLREQGFNVVSVSGGEPLLYTHLFEVLAYAGSLGMTRTLTSNGMLLDRVSPERLAETADLIAISLDGTPDSHNRVRSHPRAFQQMAGNLNVVREAKIPFGFIFTLTLHNLHELAWAAQFADEQGASLLQVHPLEEEGRASEELEGAGPDELELAHAFVEVARIQAKYSGKLTIQFDVADRDTLAADPTRAYAMPPASDAADLSLAALVAPLVLEHDGALMPFQYGMSREYEIANASRQDFAERIQDWKTSGYAPLLNLCSRVYERVMHPAAYRYPFFNWYSAVSRASQERQLVRIAS